jgi:hypothetical protein
MRQIKRHAIPLLRFVSLTGDLNLRKAAIEDTIVGTPSVLSALVVNVGTTNERLHTSYTAFSVLDVTDFERSVRT